MRFRREALVAAMVAKLVVGLPHGNRGMLAIAPGERLRDPGALAAVGPRRKAVVPAGAKAAGTAMLVMREDIRMHLHQPFRRRGSRRAEDDAQTFRMKGLDGAVQPGPVEAAGFRLDPGPGELADPHQAEPQFAHHPGVLGPVGLRPVFRIVADAEFHAAGISIQGRLSGTGRDDLERKRCQSGKR